MTARKRYGRFGPIVGAIDEGTSSARFMAFAAETSEMLTYHQVELVSTSPQEGWVEQCPLHILAAINECIEKTTENLIKLEIDPRDIVAIGVANQRETTVMWDKHTGQPLYNAIAWLDTRTSSLVDEMLRGVARRNQNVLKPLCGLPLHPCFSALKIRWLMDNVSEVQQAIAQDRCLCGTIDSWVIWNLTGGCDGGLHMTDVSNASRTMLMNLRTLKWDDALLNFFSIPRAVLPAIYSSSEIYGYIGDGPLRGVPISGCLGDEQSALVGEMCMKQGQAKSTYGTGCFFLYNTGTLIVDSNHGLVTTVAYQLGPRAQPHYALEGSIAIGGEALKWLRDSLALFQDVAETETLLTATAPSQVVCVPAFSGLFAPYWHKDATSLICGVTDATSKGQLVRAVMEAICFQTRDILEALHKDCGVQLKRLLVDGGMTVNACLMQLQADLAGIPVVRATISETTALGAAIVAGMADGIKVWDILSMPKVICDTFHPAITQDERDVRHAQWKKAVALSLGCSHRPQLTTRQQRMKAAVAPAIFIMVSIATLITATYIQS